MSRKKLALFFLLLILAIPFFNKALQVKKQSVWDGVSHINVAIDNGDIDVWSIEPSEKTIHLVVIPKNVYLSLGSYGTYRASAIGKFSLLEKKDGSLFENAMRESLAVPIDGVIVRKEGTDDIFDPTALFGPSGFLHALTNRPLSGRHTNLSSLDLFRFWLLSLSLKKESIDRVNLADTQVVSKIVLPDGGEGLTILPEQAAKLALAYFVDKKIKQEDLTIEVINDTTIPGLANEVALLLTNIGGNVVNTAKGKDEASKTVISGKTKSYTAEKIAKILGGKISEEQMTDNRADIRVVLGKE